MTEQLYQLFLESPVGQLRLISSKTGLRAVLWPNDLSRVKLPSTCESSSHHPILRTTSEQITQYFQGERKEFDVPLDLRGTEFQVATWLSLANIPYGKTITYQQQANSINRPTATRAVGSANGRNPISIVLPCHRVIGANGSLTGFAAGIATKQFLLQLEGAWGEQTLPLT